MAFFSHSLEAHENAGPINQRVILLVVILVLLGLLWLGTQTLSRFMPPSEPTQSGSAPSEVLDHLSGHADQDPAMPERARASLGQTAPSSKTSSQATPPPEVLNALSPTAH